MSSSISTSEPLRIHHVGIVVPDLRAADDYMAIFGHEEDYRGFVEAFECLCIFLKAPIGQPAVELVVPTGGALSRFNKGAGGLHHYAYATDDLRALQCDLESRGMPWLLTEPIMGAGDFLCNFLSPVATRGVVVEFVQQLKPEFE